MSGASRALRLSLARDGQRGRHELSREAGGARSPVAHPRPVDDSRSDRAARAQQGLRARLGVHGPLRVRPFRGDQPVGHTLAVIGPLMLAIGPHRLGVTLDDESLFNVHYNCLVTRLDSRRREISQIRQCSYASVGEITHTKFVNLLAFLAGHADILNWGHLAEVGG